MSPGRRAYSLRKYLFLSALTSSAFYLVMGETPLVIRPSQSKRRTAAKIHHAFGDLPSFVFLYHTNANLMNRMNVFFDRLDTCIVPRLLWLGIYCGVQLWVTTAEEIVGLHHTKWGCRSYDFNCFPMIVSLKSTNYRQIPISPTALFLEETSNFHGSFLKIKMVFLM